MATQNGSLSSAEFDWYATRSSLSQQAPLNEHKQKYFSDKGFGSNASINKPLSQQEREWLGSQTGVTSKRIPDMWVEAVAGAGKTPAKSVNENMSIFYKEVAGTP